MSGDVLYHFFCKYLLAKGRGKSPYYYWLFWYSNSVNLWLALPSSDLGGGRGVIVIVVGNGHGDTSSNLGRDIAFPIENSEFKPFKLYVEVPVV